MITRVAQAIAAVVLLVTIVGPMLFKIVPAETRESFIELVTSSKDDINLDPRKVIENGPPTTGPPPPATVKPDTSGSGSPASERPTGTINETIGLVVAPETHGDTYKREQFPHWSSAPDAPFSGWDMRDATLVSQALGSEVITDDSGQRAVKIVGEWPNTYVDGKSIRGDAKQFDIDHMIPLKEAWISGAHAWTTSQREEFANDLGDPLRETDQSNLFVTPASVNRSKGDRDPAEWMPESSEKARACWYARQWVRVKQKWELTVDPAESSALTQMLENCTQYPDRVPQRG